MAFRKTIAAKIYGLAILLLLTIALACFLLFEVTRTKQDLAVVANFDVPLTQSVSRLHEYGLRRRLAFERWFGALNAAQPNGEVVAEVSAVLDQLEPAYEVINKRQRELLDLQLAGEHERANERLNLLNDLQLGV